MKDHDIVLKSALECPDIKFILVGKDTEKLNLPNNVIPIGISNQMCELYNTADMMIHISNFGEGFPNVVGEAMSCGVPVLANDVGDCKEIIGNTGLVIKSKNIKEIIKGIREILNSSNLLTKKRCRNRIVKRYSVMKMVKLYNDLYQKL